MLKIIKHPESLRLNFLNNVSKISKSKANFKNSKRTISVIDGNLHEKRKRKPKNEGNVTENMQNNLGFHFGNSGKE